VGGGWVGGGGGESFPAQQTKFVLRWRGACSSAILMFSRPEVRLVRQNKGLRYRLGASSSAILMPSGPDVRLVRQNKGFR